MAYRLTMFGTTALPMAAPRGELGTAPAHELITPLPDGMYLDAYGTDDAPLQLPYTLPWQCEKLDNDAAALTAALDALRGLVGKMKALYLTDTTSGVQRWAWARLQREGQPWEWNRIFQQPITLTWNVLSPWLGELIGNPVIGFWQSDPSQMLMLKVMTYDAASGSGILTNSGNQNIYDAIITVTAGDAPITALMVTNAAGGHWHFNGTIAATKSLVVDCGQWSVLNDGVDAFDDFVEPEGLDYWFRLVPGANVITTAITGGGTGWTIKPQYRWQWA
jgi:hypothetical protein